MSSPGLPAYGVVVPLKRLAVAKSRLASVGDTVRRDLVTAFAVDTVTATLECTRVLEVVVVTDDTGLAGLFADLGVSALPDGHSGDLNASLVQGAAELLRRRPGLRPVALCGDLPALRADELDTVLESAAAHVTSFLADAAGTGTTLYTARELSTFSPRFGHASRQAHLDAGCTELDGSTTPSVRRDVDTPGDLADALGLGTGRRTTWVASQSGLGPAPAPRSG